MMNTTNATRRIDADLIETCEAYLRGNLYATIHVMLPDGTEGEASCRGIILSRDRGDSQDVVVRQGKRAEIWFASQLRLS